MRMFAAVSVLMCVFMSGFSFIMIMPAIAAVCMVMYFIVFMILHLGLLPVCILGLIILYSVMVRDSSKKAMGEGIMWK